MRRNGTYSWRGGRRIKVSIFNRVVGDVVHLKIGHQVPADGILISGHSLAIDESSMTGESKVTAVGINTEWGLSMASISEDTGEETPPQVFLIMNVTLFAMHIWLSKLMQFFLLWIRMNGVATFIGIVGLPVTAAVLVVLLARCFTGHTKKPDGSVQFVKGQTGTKTAINGAIKILTAAVTIVVVALPEGLPLAVTLILAYSMQKMIVDKPLVRRLSACETMGSATTICRDMTGTLTLNQAYVCGRKIVFPDSAESISPTLSSFLIEGIAQNTTGSVFEPERMVGLLRSLDHLLKKLCSLGGVKHFKLGMKFDDARSNSSIIHAFPFNSEKKHGGVAIQADDDAHVHWKGAAEIVLAACTSWLDEAGSKKSLTLDKANEFKR